ncbi:PREDICTED: SH3 domain-binding glutamic acid-rich-like protein 2 isoform X4 [Hipposideros armiger]|nr:PREDICTED: SH3 domain-binding glutamic acid-rich-like protein 2 isoform X4 [Hipposideros armiger]
MPRTQLPPPPLLPSPPSAGGREALSFLAAADPAGGIQISAILPEGSAVPGGSHSSQPSSASASAPAQSPQEQTVRPGAARGWSSACSSPPPRASWR